jgi:hypothetical protein
LHASQSESQLTKQGGTLTLLGGSKSDQAQQGQVTLENDEYKEIHFPEVVAMNAQRFFRMLKHRLVFGLQRAISPGKSVYWYAGFAEELEDWGKDHVWLEIQALLAGRSGRVLDIA